MITLGLPRLLQAGDIVRVDGQLGEVVGVDLNNSNEDAGPLFIVDLADGSTTTTRTRDVEIVKISPSSDAAHYGEEVVPCR